MVSINDENGENVENGIRTTENQQKNKQNNGKIHSALFATEACYANVIFRRKEHTQNQKGKSKRITTNKKNVTKYVLQTQSPFHAAQSLPVECTCPRFQQTSAAAPFANEAVWFGSISCDSVASSTLVLVVARRH